MFAPSRKTVKSCVIQGDRSRVMCLNQFLQAKLDFCLSLGLLHTYTRQDSILDFKLM